MGKKFYTFLILFTVFYWTSVEAVTALCEHELADGITTTLPQGLQLIVKDEHGHLKGQTPESFFHWALQDSFLSDRLQFIAQELKARKYIAKATIAHFDLDVALEDHPNPAAPPQLFIHLAGKGLSEDPNLSFQSVLTFLMFELYRIRYPKTWKELIDSVEQNIRQQGLTTAHLRKQIEKILVFRSDWHTKLSFFQSLPEDKQQCPFWKEMDAKEKKSSDILYSAMLAAFQTFYSRHSQHQMSQELIQAVWPTKLPNGWELGLLIPVSLPKPE